ncbi:DNA recombination protein RmuC [Candidatus Hydrogenisulfobacillus filiaventi]|uniref:DNA recombination protein RmuC n=1 Tax=Candidatus Hydrogenisulfobacillus filiaventi TaxID=2707344 RepID=A0A6F8ZC13_9FIRM|nr:DNA recombination protein RmuC [Bacillota bacterium]CAB1127566.1 DNA recombination protein RmuC [Candidatus Hydrogenisulfobacillus filiaventi]
MHAGTASAEVIDAAWLAAGLVLGLLAAWAYWGRLLAAAGERERFRREEAERHRQALADAEARLRELDAARLRLEAERARLEAEMAGWKSRLEESAQRAEQTRNDLLTVFQSAAAEALGRNSRQFLDLAEARLKEQEAASRSLWDSGRRVLEDLTRPLQETLEKMQARIQELEGRRERAYGELAQQVEALARAQGQLLQSGQEVREAAQRLREALRSPQVQGRWGEMQLQRVVELAGMAEHVDFELQPAMEAQRPDMVVHLPDGKQLVVDAKVALNDFLAAAEAEDPAARQAALKAHARRVREHVNSLGDKAYWRRLPVSPEFVVLFLPTDAVLSAALGDDPELLDYGFRRGVILATPSILVGLLRTVAYSWRQRAMEENARRIAELGRELYQRIHKLARDWEALGRHLQRTVEAYNTAVGSFERRVLVTARRLKELGAADEGHEVAGPEPVAEMPRELTVPEAGP